MNPRIAAASAAAVIGLASPLVMRHEGEIRHGYRDPIGIVTSCIGHTGPGAEMGRTYTHDECLQQLRTDLADHHAGLRACLKAQVPAHVEAAFLSFAFNVGVSATCRSTAMAKLNVGDIGGACAELSRWVQAGGKTLPGLVKRREAERALCEGKVM